jgi:hypothetical protein
MTFFLFVECSVVLVIFSVLVKTISKDNTRPFLCKGFLVFLNDTGMGGHSNKCQGFQKNSNIEVAKHEKWQFLDWIKGCVCVE